MKFNTFPILFLMVFPFFLPIKKTKAQDLNTFFSEISNRFQNREWIKISGGINASTMFNAIQGNERRRDPFSFRLNANLHIDILGIKAPFSASISDGNKVYQLPSYAFYGISPSYQWITLHLGDRSMEFSPYTLSGHNFYGAGIEINPGKFRLSAMKGRLKRATAEDFQHLQNLDLSFLRKGWGIKAGYESENSLLAVMVFQGTDDAESLPPENIPNGLHPMENTVLGFQAQQTLWKNILLEVHYGLSGLTRNSQSPQLINSGGLKKMAGLFTPKLSSGFYHAINSSIVYKLPFGQLGFKHERIDPGYKTLGTLFFNNDFEQWTANTNLAIFQKKINLSGSLGFQRNNLDGIKQNSHQRLIGSLNLSLQTNKKLSVNFNLVQYNNTNRQKAVTLPTLLVDSLILVQSNRNASLNATYNWEPVKKKQSTLNFMLAYQNANSIENEKVRQDQTSSYIFGNLNHSYSNSETGWNSNASLLINYGTVPQWNMLTIAPGFTLSKKVLKDKGNISAALTYSTIRINGSPGNRLFNLRLTGSTKIMERHQLNINFSFVNNNGKTEINGYRAFREISGTVGYSWNF